MNLSLYGIGTERKKSWLAIDLGVAFAGEDLPGIDLNHRQVEGRFKVVRIDPQHSFKLCLSSIVLSGSQQHAAKIQVRGRILGLLGENSAKVLFGGGILAILPAPSAAPCCMMNP